jgi:hypothetical protein
MADDPIGRWLLLVAVVVFSLVAFRPDWFIRVRSYGRHAFRDISGALASAEKMEFIDNSRNA